MFFPSVTGTLWTCDMFEWHIMAFKLLLLGVRGTSSPCQTDDLFTTALVCHSRHKIHLLKMKRTYAASLDLKLLSFGIMVINNDEPSTSRIQFDFFSFSKLPKLWSGLSCTLQRNTWSPLAFSPFTSSPSLFSVAMRHSSWSQGFHNSLPEEQKPKQWTKQGRPTQTSFHLTHTSHLWVLCWHTNGQFRISPFSFLFIFYTVPVGWMEVMHQIHSKKSTGWTFATLRVKVFGKLIKKYLGVSKNAVVTSYSKVSICERKILFKIFTQGFMCCC